MKRFIFSVLVICLLIVFSSTITFADDHSADQTKPDPEPKPVPVPDECTFTFKKVTTVSQMKQCFEKNEFSMDTAMATIETLKRMYPSYVFRDIARNSLSSNSPYDISMSVDNEINSLQTNLKNSLLSYRTDYEFHQIIASLFSKLRDPHTVYVKPLCYSYFAYLQPFKVDSKLVLTDNETNTQEQQLFLNYPSSLSRYFIDYYQLYPNDEKIVFSDYDGWKIKTINGEDALSVLKKFSKDDVSYSRDPVNRFNWAIKQAWYLRMAMFEDFPEDEMNYVVEKDGVTKSLKLRWVAIPLGTFANYDEWRYYCDFTKVKPTKTKSMNDNSFARNTAFFKSRNMFEKTEKKNTFFNNQRNNQMDSLMENVLETLNEEENLDQVSNNKMMKWIETNYPFLSMSIREILNKGLKKGVESIYKRNEILKELAHLNKFTLSYSENIEKQKELLSNLEQDSDKQNIKRKVKDYKDYEYRPLTDEIEGNQLLYKKSEDLGVLVVKTFYPIEYDVWINSIEQAMRIAHINNIKKFVVDVRANTGGYVCLGLSLAQFLVPELPVILYPAMDTIHSPVQKDITTCKINDYVDRIYSSTTDKLLDGADWYLNSTERKRGGVTSEYSENIHFQCPSILRFNVPSPLRFSSQNLTVLSDSLCGSTCGIFVKMLQQMKKSKVVTIGGIYGTNEDSSVASFKGGPVVQYSNMIQRLGIYKILGCSNIDIPSFLPTTASMTYSYFEMYPYNEINAYEKWRADMSIPNSFVKKPADFHFYDWDLENTTSIWDKSSSVFSKCAPWEFKPNENCPQKFKFSVSGSPCKDPSQGTYDENVCVVYQCEEGYYLSEDKSECLVRPLPDPTERMTLLEYIGRQIFKAFMLFTVITTMCCLCCCFSMCLCCFFTVRFVKSRSKHHEQQPQNVVVELGNILSPTSSGPTNIQQPSTYVEQYSNLNDEDDE